MPVAGRLGVSRAVDASAAEASLVAGYGSAFSIAVAANSDPPLVIPCAFTRCMASLIWADSAAYLKAFVTSLARKHGLVAALVSIVEFGFDVGNMTAAPFEISEFALSS